MVCRALRLAEVYDAGPRLGPGLAICRDPGARSAEGGGGATVVAEPPGPSRMRGGARVISYASELVAVDDTAAVIVGGVSYEVIVPRPVADRLEARASARTWLFTITVSAEAPPEQACHTGGL